MALRLPGWLRPVDRTFTATDPETGIVRRIVLSGSVLRYQGRLRQYEYAVGPFVRPADAISRAWGFTDVAETLA